MRCFVEEKAIPELVTFSYESHTLELCFIWGTYPVLKMNLLLGLSGTLSSIGLCFMYFCVFSA